MTGPVPASPPPVEPDDVPGGHGDGPLVVGYFRMERWEVPSSPGSDAFAELEARAVIDDHHRSPAGGMVTGGVVSLADSLGGMACGLAVRPEWIVTNNLMTRMVRLHHVGPLHLHARLLRRGRASVVATIDVDDEGAGGASVAHAMMTCAVLEPTRPVPAIERPVHLPLPPLDPRVGTPDEYFGIERDGPLVRLHPSLHHRNHWDILHGGATASLVDIAAAHVVAQHGVERHSVEGEHRTQGLADGGGALAPVVSADTLVHYLRPTRVGPLEARCRIIGSRPDGTVVRVAVHDLGADARQVALGSVTVRPVRHRPTPS